MTAQWQEVATYHDWSSVQQAAASLNDTRFATGDHGAVSVDLPFAVPDALVSAVQAAIDAAGVEGWDRVYIAEGNRLVIPFVKRSPTIPVIVAVLVGLTIAGIIFVTIWRLMAAAEAIAGPWGLLLAGGALLFLAPAVLGESRRAVYANPHPLTSSGRTGRVRRIRRNPLDTTSLLQIGGAGLVAFAGFEAAGRGMLPGPLQNIAHSLWPDKIPAAPPQGAVKAIPPNTPHGGQPQQATNPIFPGFKVGNTRLEFAVNPTDPPRQEGAPVTYSGRLTMIPPLVGVFTGEQPLSGETIEFWDGSLGRRFDQAETDSQGFYLLERPLATDEMDGYQVFARYSGSTWLGRDPYITGLWAVVPQG